MALPFPSPVHLNLESICNNFLPDGEVIITEIPTKLGCIITNTRGNVLAYDVPLHFENVEFIRCKASASDGKILLTYTNTTKKSLIVHDSHRRHEIFPGDEFVYSLYFQ